MEATTHATVRRAYSHTADAVRPVAAVVDGLLHAGHLLEGWLAGEVVLAEREVAHVLQKLEELHVTRELLRKTRIGAIVRRVELADCKPSVQVSEDIRVQTAQLVRRWRATAAKELSESRKPLLQMDAHSPASSTESTIASHSVMPSSRMRSVSRRARVLDETASKGEAALCSSRSRSRSRSPRRALVRRRSALLLPEPTQAGVSSPLGVETPLQAVEVAALKIQKIQNAEHEGESNSGNDGNDGNDEPESAVSDQVTGLAWSTGDSRRDAARSMLVAAVRKALSLCAEGEVSMKDYTGEPSDEHEHEHEHEGDLSLREAVVLVEESCWRVLGSDFAHYSQQVRSIVRALKDGRTCSSVSAKVLSRESAEHACDWDSDELACEEVKKMRQEVRQREQLATSTVARGSVFEDGSFGLHPCSECCSARTVAAQVASLADDSVLVLCYDCGARSRY